MIETIYFGTYTKKTSQGIYCADFDSSNGEISNLQLVAKEDNPTYLSFSTEGNLYTVTNGKEKGGIASYDSDFQLLNKVVEDGPGLCYIAVDNKRGLVYGANYHKGQLNIYKCEENGSLTLLNTLQHHGSGPHPNQARAHVHFSDLTPDKYLITCDLGTDEVTTHMISPQGQLIEIGKYKAASGSGPRHLVFHKEFKIAYLVCELNATIEVLIYDGYGQFEHYQTVSTLPDNYDGFNACAAIRISHDSRFVYVSNRGHDSIAVFEVIGDGVLERRQIIPSAGRSPRGFNLSSDDNFLIAVHQDSDNATVFKRDPKSGLLTEISHDFKVPEAVCLVFK